MFLIVVISAILLVGFIGFMVTIYKHLVTLKQAINQARSNLEVILKQRYEELPKLVAVCKQYRINEVLLEQIQYANDAVAKAAVSQDINLLSQVEADLQLNLSQLFVVVEQYPDLKADKKFLQLEQTIHLLENTIANRCENYNEAVQKNNVTIAQLPNMLIAKLFNFKSAGLLPFSD